VVRWGRHLDRGVGGAGRMVGRRPLGGRRSTSKRRPVEVDGREEDGEYEGGGSPERCEHPPEDGSMLFLFSIVLPVSFCR
jgi:hypothetical protein